MAQALDEGGMDYLSLSTHLMSMPEGSLPNEPPHHYVGPYREPMVLFAYLAGLTQRIKFRTAVLILPLYATALLAKQAGDVSIASGGRLELGVGISWNAREYEALGQDIHVRGKRMEEQLTLLKRMWTEPFVTFEGRWHKIDGMGLNQLPPPIPIYIGTGVPAKEHLLRRIARLGDGWIPLGDAVEGLKALRPYLEKEGRDPATFPVCAMFFAMGDEPKAWVERARRLRDGGVNDIHIFAAQLSGPAATARLLAVRKVLSEELG
jgi:probable F420-dependent oxidoreductase